jgi:hypothetical protein
VENHHRFRPSCLLLAFLVVPMPAAAEPFFDLHLDPNVYTVFAGDTVTLSGFFTTGPDAVTYTYGNVGQGVPELGDEFLFGLSATSPHLGLVAGSFFTARDFDPPIGTAHFEDTFGLGGYLGPVSIVGPTTTTVSDLRTFLVPPGTPPGIYRYSYGVIFNVDGKPVDGLFDPFTVEVQTVPEPSAMVMVLTGLSSWVVRKRRKDLLRRMSCP